MPELPAPSTEFPRLLTQPARFQFVVTWSSLYAPVAPPNSVVKSTGPHSRAVIKTPAEPDISWAMVVPKMYRPLPRRRKVHEIAPPARRKPVPTLRQIEAPRPAEAARPAEAQHPNETLLPANPAGPIAPSNATEAAHPAGTPYLVDRQQAIDATSPVDSLRPIEARHPAAASPPVAAAQLIDAERPAPIPQPADTSVAHATHIAARGENRIPVQRILAFAGAGLAAASLAVFLIPRGSSPKENHPASERPSAVVAKPSATPVAPESVRRRKSSAVKSAAARSAPKPRPAPIIARSTHPAAEASRASVARTTVAPRIAAQPAEAPTSARTAAEAAARVPNSAQAADAGLVAPHARQAPGSASEPPPARFVLDPPQMAGFEGSRVISKVKPIYPQVAKLAQVQGTVRLKATIATDGSVQTVELESGPALLAEAAIEAVRLWTFLPATRNGTPVEDVTHIDLSFALVK